MTVLDARDEQVTDWRTFLLDRFTTGGNITLDPLEAEQATTSTLLVTQPQYDGIYAALQHIVKKEDA